MSILPSRRTVLRGLLAGSAVSVGLPILECTLGPNGRAFADGGLLPRRFGLFFWGNGMLPDRWNPTTSGEGDAWELSEQLAGLASVKDVINVITNMQVRMPNTIPHWTGTYGLLSGIIPIGEEGNHTCSGPTIDQIIAAELGGETIFRSIEAGARPGGGGGVSFNGPHSNNPAESSPTALFERIFGANFIEPGSDGQVDPKIALRRSVLDAVLDQSNDLRGRVGAADKARLDQHMDGIRDLELRLGRLEEDPPDLAACVLPDEPPPDETYATIRESHRVISDLLVMALACDQTRIFSNQLTHPIDNYLWPGTDRGHHQLTHDEPDPQPQVHEIVLQIVDDFRYFVEALRAVPEGDGTLLDNMAVLATSGISLGRTHSLDEFPLLTAGSCCGALKTNVHYRASSPENASKVILTMMRAMGMLVNSFGEGDAETTDTLSAIET
ncbi:MAG: DUF1552 domain-containing protein [Proteobacteria bacterium]|nr:DUF1552 domain-containing protein [Pseudomonadota bacterium]